MVERDGSTVSHMINSSGSTAVGNLNLNLEASIQRLEVVEEENRRLNKAISRVVSESRMVLESSIVDLQIDFNQKISQLSEKLQSMYDEDTALHPSLSRPRGLFNRKLFLPRESLLSTMLHHNDENYKTIFNIAISVLFLWGIWLAIEDYEEVPRSYNPDPSTYSNSTLTIP